MSANESAARTRATQEIEYLRRWYAKATDLIGTAKPDAIDEGRKIFHRVFTPGAQITAGRHREAKVGPDAWVDLVLGQLGTMGPTQHLIGTQIVEIKELELDDSCNVVTGSAHMESYLQAWHELDSERVWLFLGTYFDEVVYVTGTGWQITKMDLQQVTGETRYLGKSAVQASQ